MEAAGIGTTPPEDAALIPSWAAVRGAGDPSYMGLQGCPSVPVDVVLDADVAANSWDGSGPLQTKVASNFSGHGIS